MKRTVLATAYGFLLAGAGAAQEIPAGTLFGRVWSQTTGTPLGRAVIELRAAGVYRFASTDAEGRYRLEAVAPGLYIVRARALDHAPFEASVDIPSGRPVALDLTLELQPVPLPPVSTRITGADGDESIPASGAAGDGTGSREQGESELRALEASPGIAELGLGGRGGDGGPSPGDPSSALYVRGAAYDLKLVLLDGAPVYAPFHLGGLIEAFAPGVLGSSRLFAGGAPARYDGGLSYVLDLGLRSGDTDRFRVAGTVDMLSAGVRLEAPLAGGAVTSLFSGRALHGAGYAALSGGTELPYGYADAVGRVDVRTGASGAISATGFWNRESVDLGMDSVADSRAQWGNRAGSLRYRGAVGGGALLLTAASGRFETSLPIAGEEPRSAEGYTSRSRLAADYVGGRGDVGFGLGVSYDLYRGGYLEEPGKTAGVRSISYYGESAGAYSELSWRALPALDLRFGLRGDLFLPGSDLRIAPRLAAQWHVTPRTRLRLAGGRYHQYVRGPESILSGALGPAAAPPTNPLPDVDGSSDLEGIGSFSVAGATHLVLGLDNELDEGLRLGLEGYLKQFDGLPFEGVVRASGADLWLHRDTGPIRGWLGYSIGWAWSEDPDATVETGFVGRMLLTGGIDGLFPAGFEGGIRLAYGAGLPFTAIPTTLDAASPGGEAPGGDGDPPGGGGDSSPPPPSLAGAPTGDYLRLDARISRRWTARLGDRRLEILPYLRILNALDRRDALFYFLNAESDLRPEALSSVPILAVLGVEWAF